MRLIRVGGVLLLAGWLAGCAQPPEPAEPVAATMVRTPWKLLLTDPALPVGRVLQQSSPEVRDWLRTEGLSHTLRGRVLPSRGSYNLRPWLYTTTWLPQPVVPVAEDGSFTAEFFFDPAYDDSLVITLELEDRVTHRVVASEDLFLLGCDRLEER